jgi:hypothetical protein
MSGMACPAGALYCADFESADLPKGTVYKRNAAPPMNGELPDFVVDTTVFHGGGKSLRVKTTAENSGSAYRMLAAPAAQKFWARLYLRSDQAIGAGSVSESEHNAWFGASTADDPNGKMVEVANDCGIAFNASDAVKRPTSSDPNCAKPFTLEANKWYCFEASFDGGSGDTALYVDGEKVIDAPAWAGGKGTFTHFKFGVNTFGHTKFDRKLWYDDVAVSATRIGCL